MREDHGASGDRPQNGSFQGLRAMPSGDVTSALRVAVEGLPQAFLHATLVAQLPPTEDMRPVNPDAPLEPLVPGAPINPRDYSGRRTAPLHRTVNGARNWLSSCRKVAETSGLEAFRSRSGSLSGQIVFFPHVLLTEASSGSYESSKGCGISKSRGPTCSTCTWMSFADPNDSMVAPGPWRASVQEPWRPRASDLF